MVEEDVGTERRKIASRKIESYIRDEDDWANQQAKQIQEALMEVKIEGVIGKKRQLFGLDWDWIVIRIRLAFYQQKDNQKPVEAYLKAA